MTPISGVGHGGDDTKGLRDASWPAGGLPHGEHPYDYGYTGPDESVECAYPPCTNRLRRSDFDGPQWCSKEHREASRGSTSIRERALEIRAAELEAERDQAYAELAQAHANIDQLLAELKRSE